MTIGVVHGVAGRFGKHDWRKTVYDWSEDTTWLGAWIAPDNDKIENRIAWPWHFLFHQ